MVINSVNQLDVFSLAKELRIRSWEIYKSLNWQDKKICGDQFIRSVDSIGANIAEGFGRFHYLDKNKFYYNGRGSLLEAKFWIGVLREREFILDNEVTILNNIIEKTLLKLNALIKSQYLKKNPNN